MTKWHKTILVVDAYDGLLCEVSRMDHYSSEALEEMRTATLKKADLESLGNALAEISAGVWAAQRYLDGLKQASEK